MTPTNSTNQPPVQPQAPPQGYPPQAYPQQAYPQQPVVQTAPAPAPVPVTVVPAHAEQEAGSAVLRIYGHSNLFYWWPVWVAGFIMALLTYLNGHRVPIGDKDELLMQST